MLLKVFYLKKNIVLIRPTDSEFKNVENLVEEIKIFISKERCNNIILDLTELNFLNSIRVGILAATYHFVEFINGKIYLVVQDKQVKKSIEVLNFNNTVIIYNQNSLSLGNII
ncbi:MAG: STAS domain-containing protein [bacterium]